MKSKRAWYSRCKNALMRYGSSYPEDVRLKKTFPSLRLAILQGSSSVSSARVVPGREPRIEIALAFLNELDEQCTRDADIIRVTFGDQDAPGDGTARRSIILDAVRDFATQFIVLHEVSHILCGHLDSVQRPGQTKALALDETSLGIEGTTKEDSDAHVDPTEIHRAYFLEMEADNTAIQWLMQGPISAALVRFLRSRLPREYTADSAFAMVDLRGAVRVEAFRVLLSACWSVIALMERKRGNALKGSRTHPTSEARLVGAIFTLMEQYAELATSVTDPRTGGKFHRLTPHHHEACVAFFAEVAKSIFIERVAEYFRAKDGQEKPLDALAVLQGVRESLADAPSQSKLDDELRAIEILRPTMVCDLESFRYFYNEKPSLP